MLKRYTVKNPYDEFEIDFYSKLEIDVIYDDISDTITQTDLDNAIVGFIPCEDVHVKASAFTEDFQTEDVINSIVSDFVDGYISYEEIDSRIDVATSEFLDNEELSTKMSNFLVGYITNTSVNLLIDSSVTYLQEYWHPLPIYERYVQEPAISSIDSDDRSYVDFVLSANTSWIITDNFPIGWVTLDTFTGFGTTVIRATVNSENTSGSIRTHTYIGTAPDVYKSPFEVTITQLAAGVPH